MPRLTADRRLEIMTGALERAAARPGGRVALETLAIAMEITESDLRQSLEALRWIEVTVPAGIVSLVDAIDITDDGYLVVAHDWWHRMIHIGPKEAARLYVQAATTAAVGKSAPMVLKTAMQKLRRIVGAGTIEIAEGPRPPMVKTLTSARDEGRLIIADIEGTSRTVATIGAGFVVAAVFRDGGEWMVALVSHGGNSRLGLGDGDAITIPTGKIVHALPGEQVDVASIGGAPRITGRRGDLEVTIEYPIRRDFVLDAFEVLDQQDLPGDRRRARVLAWGLPELKTLLLRLGPDAAVVQPAELVDLQRRAAREILAVYD